MHNYHGTLRTPKYAAWAQALRDRVLGVQTSVYLRGGGGTYEAGSFDNVRQNTEIESPKVTAGDLS